MKTTFKIMIFGIGLLIGSSAFGSTSSSGSDDDFDDKLAALLDDSDDELDRNLASIRDEINAELDQKIMALKSVYKNAGLSEAHKTDIESTIRVLELKRAGKNKGREISAAEIERLAEELAKIAAEAEEQYRRDKQRQRHQREKEEVYKALIGLGQNIGKLLLSVPF